MGSQAALTGGLRSPGSLFQLRFEHAQCAAMGGYWCPTWRAGRSEAPRDHIGFNEAVEIVKDGQSWRIGTSAQIGWIANGTSIDQSITSAIPPVMRPMRPCGSPTTTASPRPCMSKPY